MYPLGSMATTRGLRAKVWACIEAECGLMGFDKRAQIFFTKRFGAEVLGGLAFVLDIDGELFVNPSAAVRHQPLERLVADLTGKKFHPYLFGTLGGLIGNIPPLNDFIIFEFPDGTDVASRVGEMFSLIRQVVIPWMERHPDLDSFIEDIKTHGYGGREGRYMRRSVAHYMRQEFGLARNLLSEGLELMHDDEDFRRFADALLARMPH
jgi:hypothetical protein